MLRPSLQSLFAVCAFFSVAFANALPNNGPVKYETVVVYETITTCFITSSVYTIPPPPTSTCTSTPGGAIISPPPPPPTSTSVPAQEYTTSTVYVTTVRTITSCATTVTNCPATEATHTYVVTDTISSYTTVCPVTETQTPSGPSSSYPASPPPYSSSSVSPSKSYSKTKSYGSTSPSSSASGSSSYSVGTSSTPSGSSASTVKPTSSTVSPYSSSSVSPSSPYSSPSSSSSVSPSYSASSPLSSPSKSPIQSTSSILPRSSSSPTYSPSKSTSSTASSPTYSPSKSTSSTVSVPSSSSSPTASSTPSYSTPKSTSSSTSSTPTYSTPKSSSSSTSSTPSYSTPKSTSSSTSSTLSSSSASKSTPTPTSSTSSTYTSSSASKSTPTTSSTTSSTKSSTTSSSTSKTSSSSSSTPTPTACSYWMENIKHQGVAPFAGSGYQVFRNVKDSQWGAKGDGVTDDTAAIQRAINTGTNCAPDGTCGSSSTTPALVYFPPGTYLITSSIALSYGSSLVGNPNCPPVLKASSSFNAAFLIDADKYQSTGNLAFGATNTFWRQFRNFVIDITSVPASLNVVGLHWPTAQATSVENVVFKMSAASGTQHGGMLSEQGSGGFMANLTFNGGIYGLDAANQQFTMRNLNFNNAVTAIKQDFNWGWVYKGISISNCKVGIQFGLDGNTADANFNDTTVSSVTIIDSSIVNTPVGISLQVRNELASRPSEESLIIENLSISNVPIVVGSAAGPTLLPGSTGSSTIAGWGRGASYTTTGHTKIQGTITPATRPGVLTTSGGAFYSRSKPQYETYQNTSFVSVRTAGAKGDGVTDDTVAIISAITSALASGSIVYFDAGYYVVSNTIYIPPGSKITGEGYPVILATGSVFGNMGSPAPVFQVGKSGGEKGTVEWSNMIVSTKGAAPGATLIEWNLDATGLAPAGMWDVHTRIGGFKGSNLQVGQCPTGTFDSRNGNVTMTSANLPQQCIGAFMSMHVTKQATGLYMENVWLWVADHDVDDSAETQITIFAGRGLLVESTAGAIWMYGTAVEHHALYQYQLANTANIYMGEIQTETPYYQPNPNTAIPFPAVTSLNDPPVESDALGLRILSSNNILIYGAGLYSFFSNYYVHCSDAGNGEWCQSRIFSVEKSTAITVYGLDTVGTQNMITVDGNNVASYVNNIGATGFIDTIAMFKV